MNLKEKKIITTEAISEEGKPKEIEVTKFGFKIESTDDVWTYDNVEYDSIVFVEEKKYCFLFEDLVGVFTNGSNFFKAEGLKIWQDFNKIENKLWGTMGISGKEQYRFIPLYSLSNAHINNILNGPFEIKVKDEYKKYFERRLAYY